MRTIISDIPSDGMSVYSNIKMWLALANGGEWTDTHIPRTERPVRFCYLSNAPESRPCIARGYMGYARPVRFA